MASSASGSDHVASSDSPSSEMSATRGTPLDQSGRHQEQPRRTLLPQDSRAFLVPHPHRTSSLPFPLNLPPSYPVYPSSSPPTASARPPRHPLRQQSASLSASQLLTRTSDATEANTRVRNALSASCSKGKGKGTLDAFMDSRRGSTLTEPESSGSDSDVPLGKMTALPPSDDYPFSDSSALPLSSPPSSSPLRTPRESPVRPMYPYASSPTLKCPSQALSNVPFVLPPGPYSLQKPRWSLSALIGQALNASLSGSLALNDIYSYVSTVYPHYDRAEQSWMSSIRHNLSLQDAFERLPEEKDKPKKGRKKSKGKGGSWRIKPGYEACFFGGSYVKKGAKGPGPGLNHSRKRPSQDDGERKDKRMKAETSTSHFRSATPISSTSTRFRTHSRPSSPTRTIYSDPHSRKLSSPPSLTSSQSTGPSEASLPDPSELPPSSPIAFEGDSDMICDSPSIPLSLGAARRNPPKDRTFSSGPSLEPGFELSRISGLQQSSPRPALEIQGADVNRDLFTRVLASTSSTHAFASESKPSSSPNPVRLLFPPPFTSSQAPSSPSRTRTPPPRRDGVNATFSPSRTPMSHKGVHMSPSRSLAHYKSSLEPEWKTATGSSGHEGRVTPPPGEPHELGNETTSTPRRFVFPAGPPQASPFRTPTRSTTHQLRTQWGYDPYDPNTLLADELASIRNANNPQESPGGFFGKEGRKLLYESPGIPSRSHWRFKDEF